jgi:hypothetical protein
MIPNPEMVYSKPERLGDTIAQGRARSASPWVVIKSPMNPVRVRQFRVPPKSMDFEFGIASKSFSSHPWNPELI